MNIILYFIKILHNFQDLKKFISDQISNPEIYFVSSFWAQISQGSIDQCPKFLLACTVLFLKNTTRAQGALYVARHARNNCLKLTKFALVKLNVPPLSGNLDEIFLSNLKFKFFCWKRPTYSTQIDLCRNFGQIREMCFFE